MSHTQILYHLVFATQKRRRVLVASGRETLFRYWWGLMKNKQCHLHQVNGVEDHVHFLFSLHPTIALSALVKDLKIASAKWIKTKNVFPGFDHWQSGYGAFTHSLADKERLMKYIQNQETHHRKMDFREEYKHLLQEHGIEFDEQYLE